MIRLIKTQRQMVNKLGNIGSFYILGNGLNVVYLKTIKQVAFTQKGKT